MCSSAFTPFYSFLSWKICKPHTPTDYQIKTRACRNKALLNVFLKIGQKIEVLFAPIVNKSDC